MAPSPIAHAPPPPTDPCASSHWSFPPGGRVTLETLHVLPHSLGALVSSWQEGTWSTSESFLNPQLTDENWAGGVHAILCAPSHGVRSPDRLWAHEHVCAQALPLLACQGLKLGLQTAPSWLVLSAA